MVVDFESHDPQLAAQWPTPSWTCSSRPLQNRHNAIMKSSEWLAPAAGRHSRPKNGNFQQGPGRLSGFHRGFRHRWATEHLYRAYGRTQPPVYPGWSGRTQLEALLKNVQGNADWLPAEVRNNPVVQQLTQKLAEQKAELAQAQSSYPRRAPGGRKSCKARLMNCKASWTARSTPPWTPIPGQLRGRRGSA